MATHAVEVFQREADGVREAVARATRFISRVRCITLAGGERRV
jgi:hypothetical protein